jgi:hypothetical protein
MSTYIFDIETGPRSRAELAECVPTFEAPSNWKDPEKIRAHVAEKEAEWFQSAALSALTGRVLAIGYLDAVTDEQGLLSAKVFNSGVKDSRFRFTSNDWQLTNSSVDRGNQSSVARGQTLFLRQSPVLICGNPFRSVLN